MTSQDIAEPLHEADKNVQEQILVHAATTKAAVRKVPVVQDGPVHMDTDNDEEDDDVPESQPSEMTIVSAAQPLKRQKTGFEPAHNFQDSFIGMPMDNTGVTSGLPPAPPPTPDIPQFKFIMPTPSKKDAPKTRAMARRELQENVKSGAPIGDDVDPEDINDAVTLVNTEANTPPNARLKRYRSKATDGGSPTSSNSGSPRSSGVSPPPQTKKLAVALQHDVPGDSPQPTPLPWPKDTLWDYDRSRYMDERRRKEADEPQDWIGKVGK
ncbi:hypothetical protein SBRCBS47491_003692 [Sporothrix bragantina]|uniref:Uncharacterized protein n=1 Tax=Sporothrix bragantina TaxID=671064 RepID=A0ABP0BH84_9PEZI